MKAHIRQAIPFLISTFAAVAVVASLWWAFAVPNQAIAAPSYNPRSGDPCTLNLRSVALVNLTASGQLITGVTGKQTYICHIGIISASAQNIALVEGTGTTCATSTAGMAGGATAATGWNLAANQLVVEGVGNAWVTATATAADNVCLLLSGSGQTSGVVQYAQQ